MAKFEGSLVDCIKDFGQKTKGKFAYRRKVAHLMGLNTYTVHTWLNKHKSPGGLNLLKLFLLLELNGYVVTEAKMIDPKIREYGKLLAMEVLKMDVAVNALEAANPNGILKIMLGRSGTSHKKMAEIEATLAENEWKKASQTKFQEWINKAVFVEKQTKTIADTEKREPFVGIGHNPALEIFAHQVKAMIPLAEWIVSNQFTADERHKLREFSSNGRSNDVFKLSTILNRLCSETARKEM